MSSRPFLLFVLSFLVLAACASHRNAPTAAAPSVPTHVAAPTRTEICAEIARHFEDVAERSVQDEALVCARRTPSSAQDDRMATTAARRAVAAFAPAATEAAQRLVEMCTTDGAEEDLAEKACFFSAKRTEDWIECRFVTPRFAPFGAYARAFEDEVSKSCGAPKVASAPKTPAPSTNHAPAKSCNCKKK